MKYMGFVLALLLPVIFGSGAVAGTKKQFKVMKGTWTCAVSNERNAAPPGTDCSDPNHEHCLKLDDGTYVTFLKNNRSTNLLAGGGRHDLNVQVCGFYDPEAHTIDVECYNIDGLWNSWCDVHNRMDTCRQAGEPIASSAGAEGSQQ
jgi:hypothetical protein